MPPLEPPPPPPPAQPESIARPIIAIYTTHNYESKKMTKLYKYYIHLLLLLALFGCGNTLTRPTNSIEIINQNSATLIVDEFKLTKLQKEVDFDGLPKALASYKNQMGKFDFYLAQSPTQGSGGFVFEISQNSGLLVICLKRPAPFTIVGTVLSNPIALIKVTKGFNVKMDLGFCER